RPAARYTGCSMARPRALRPPPSVRNRLPAARARRCERAETPTPPVRRIERRRRPASGARECCAWRTSSAPTRRTWSRASLPSSAFRRAPDAAAASIQENIRRRLFLRIEPVLREILDAGFAQHVLVDEEIAGALPARLGQHPLRGVGHDLGLPPAARI